MLSALLVLLVMGIAGIIAIGLVMAMLGFVVSLAFGAVGFLLFKVAPLLLIVWVVVKLVERSRDRRRISAADQRWLDGE
jgi:hypothetical protein